MGTLPQVSIEQRRAGLVRAAHAREVRSKVKDRLKTGELDLPTVLNEADFDDDLANMRVAELLRSLPEVQHGMADGIMREIGIASARRIRGLGERQRQALFARFGRQMQ